MKQHHLKFHVVGGGEEAELNKRPQRFNVPYISYKLKLLEFLKQRRRLVLKSHVGARRLKITCQPSTIREADKLWQTAIIRPGTAGRDRPGLPGKGRQAR